MASTTTTLWCITLARMGILKPDRRNARGRRSTSRWIGPMRFPRRRAGYQPRHYVAIQPSAGAVSNNHVIAANRRAASREDAGVDCRRVLQLRWVTFRGRLLPQETANWTDALMIRGCPLNPMATSTAESRTGSGCHGLVRHSVGRACNIRIIRRHDAADSLLPADVQTHARTRRTQDTDMACIGSPDGSVEKRPLDGCGSGRDRRTPTERRKET